MKDLEITKIRELSKKPSLNRSNCDDFLNFTDEGETIRMLIFYDRETYFQGVDYINLEDLEKYKGA